jgi:predicted HTH domain antitoxin
MIVFDSSTLILLAMAELLVGKAAELAGLPVGQMMTILAEFGVENRIDKEDHLQGLKNLTKVG